jgi:hypothetical protein
MFVNEVKKWIATPEGKGYKFKQNNSQAEFLFVLKKGSILAEIFLNSVLTRLEFKIVKEANNNIEICAYGYRKRYTYFFIPIERRLSDKASRLTGRKKGWDEMMSLLTFLGVENYKHSFK